MSFLVVVDAALPGPLSTSVVVVVRPLYVMFTPVCAVSGRRIPIGRPRLSNVYVYITVLALFALGSGTVTSCSVPSLL